MRLERPVVEWLDRKAEGSRRSRNDVACEILEAAMEREGQGVATHLSKPVAPVVRKVSVPEKLVETKRSAAGGKNLQPIVTVSEDQDSDEEHMEYCQDPSCRRCKKIRSGR